MSPQYFCIIISFLQRIFFSHALVVMTIDISDYRNPWNYKIGNGKCESFDFLGDHCDPMFKICIGSNNDKCDIYKNETSHWKNTKVIQNVFNMQVVLKNFPELIQIYVEAYDIDQYDAHDHIANFKKTFRILPMVKDYRDKMTVIPQLTNVQLTSSVKFNCDQNYYGPKCETFCEPTQFYNCDRISGSRYYKKCEIHGQYGDTKRGVVVCICDSGWTGRECNIKKLPHLTSSKKPTLPTSPTSPTTSKRHSAARTESLTSTVIPKGTSTSNKLNLYSQRLNEGTNLAALGSSRQQNPHNMTSIVIICLLLLLCLCILALLVVIGNWYRSKKKKQVTVSPQQRPLPSIGDSALTRMNNPCKNTLVIYPNNCYKTAESTFIYDYGTPIIDKAFDESSVYEVPIENNQDNITCDTVTVMHSNEDDDYMVPNK